MNSFFNFSCLRLSVRHAGASCCNSINKCARAPCLRWCNVIMHLLVTAWQQRSKRGGHLFHCLTRVVELEPGGTRKWLATCRAAVPLTYRCPRSFASRKGSLSLAAELRWRCRPRPKRASPHIGLGTQGLQTQLGVGSRVCEHTAGPSQPGAAVRNPGVVDRLSSQAPCLLQPCSVPAGVCWAPCCALARPTTTRRSSTQRLSAYAQRLSRPQQQTPLANW